MVPAGRGVTLPPTPGPRDIWQRPEMFGFALRGRGCYWLFTGWGQGCCLRRLPAAKRHPAPNVSCAKDKKAVPKHKKAHTCTLPRVSRLTFLNLESRPQSDHRLVSCRRDKCHSDSPWNSGPKASLPRGGRHPACPFWESQTGSFVLPLEKAVACQPPYQSGLFYKPVKFCGWSGGGAHVTPSPPARRSMDGVNSRHSCSCTVGGPAQASLCCGSPWCPSHKAGATSQYPHQPAPPHCLLLHTQ